jgi:hypothetical protein
MWQLIESNPTNTLCFWSGGTSLQIAFEGSLYSILFCSVSLSWLCFSLSYCSNPVAFCIHCKNLLSFWSSWSKVHLLCAWNLFFSVVGVLFHNGKASWGELWQEDPNYYSPVCRPLDCLLAS